MKSCACSPIPTHHNQIIGQIYYMDSFSFAFLHKTKGTSERPLIPSNATTGIWRWAVYLHSVGTFPTVGHRLSRLSHAGNVTGLPIEFEARVYLEDSRLCCQYITLARPNVRSSKNNIFHPHQCNATQPVCRMQVSSVSYARRRYECKLDASENILTLRPPIQLMR